MKQLIVLSNWSVRFRGVLVDPFRTPELQQVQVLQGTVTGHPGFQDGTPVTTSTIIGKSGEEAVVTKSGTHYILHEVDPEYEKLFPGAHQRLFNSLPEVP